MSLLEKLELVAENQPEVYEAGAKTFGATEIKSGVGSVTLTNVHPVEHDINVAIKTKSKNLIDISRLGAWDDVTVVENGIQINYVNTSESWFYVDVFSNAAEYLNKPLMISMELDNIQTDDDNFMLYVVPFYHGYDYFGATCLSKTTTKVSMPIMFKESDIDPEYPDYYLSLNFNFRSSDGEPHDYSFLIKNIQIEIGEEVTEYEPYFPSINPTEVTVTNGNQTVAFNEDGTIGISSIYPTTTLTLNKSDVALTAEYFVDVNNISEGVDTSDATAAADEIFAGETAYSNGEKITGTFTIDNELTTQDNLISQIQTALEGKAIGGGNTASYDTCTVNIVNILQNHVDIQGIAYVTVDSNENIVSIYDTIITSSYSCSCLCNSFIVVKLMNDSVSLDYSSGIRYLGNFYSKEVQIYQIMATNGTTVTINVTAEVGNAD